LQPFPMMFGFPFPWCLAFIVLPIIKHNFPFPFHHFAPGPFVFFPMIRRKPSRPKESWALWKTGKVHLRRVRIFFFVNFRDLSSRKASTYTYTYIYIHQFIWVYVGSHMGSYMGLDGFIYEFIGVYTWN
jgi:hypothetical protein